MRFLFPQLPLLCGPYFGKHTYTCVCMCFPCSKHTAITPWHWVSPFEGSPILRGIPSNKDRGRLLDGQVQSTTISLAFHLRQRRLKTEYRTRRMKGPTGEVDTVSPGQLAYDKRLISSSQQISADLSAKSFFLCSSFAWVQGKGKITISNQHFQRDVPKFFPG